MQVSSSKLTERMTCHIGGLKVIHAGITIGEEKGIIEAHTDKSLSGALMTTKNMMNKEIIIGRVIGKERLSPSPVSSPTTEPTAANIDEYKK